MLQTIEWVCEMCQRRRKLVTSTGLWYHGYNGGKDLADVEMQLERLRMPTNIDESMSTTTGDDSVAPNDKNQIPPPQEQAVCTSITSRGLFCPARWRYSSHVFLIHLARNSATKVFARNLTGKFSDS